MKRFLFCVSICLICIFSSVVAKAAEPLNLFNNLEHVAKPTCPLGINFGKKSPLLDVARKPINIPERQQLEEVSGFGASRNVVAAYSCNWGNNYAAIVLVSELAEGVQADMLLFEKGTGAFVGIQNVYSEINLGKEVLISESKLSDYTFDGMPDLLVREYYFSSIENPILEELTYSLYSWDGSKFEQVSADGLENELLGLK